MMVMNTGVRMSKANVLSGLEDMHQQSVECITQFTDIKGTSQKAYSFFEESLESMRALERCIDEARELIDVLDYCMKETATAEKDVEKYIGLSATSGNSESGNIPDALPSQNTDGNILPKYTAKKKDNVEYNINDFRGDDGRINVSYSQKGIGQSVCVFNRGTEVACTFMTLYQLNKKGIEVPFNCQGANGNKWFDNCMVAPEKKYATIAEEDGIPGKNGLQILFDEYMASDQTEPLENIVVSFSHPKNSFGHVLLIDHITKDGMIYFKDNSGVNWNPNNIDSRWDYLEANGNCTDANSAYNAAASAIDDAPIQKLTLKQFIYKYCDENMGGNTINGAVVFGTPQ